MPKSIALDIDSLCVSYGSAKVLDTLSLQVKSGEVFGLIGLNGQGKTTLIKSILDLTQVDDGRIEIFGDEHHIPQTRA